MQIYRGTLADGGVHTLKFLFHEILARSQYFFYFKGLEKAHTQM